MHYTPHIDFAFSSVEHIMRDVNNGWLIRYVHANGASMFFIVIYGYALKDCLDIEIISCVLQKVNRNSNVDIQLL